MRESKQGRNKLVNRARLRSRKCAPLLKNLKRLRNVNAEAEKMAEKKQSRTEAREPERVVEGLGKKIRAAREAEGLSIRQLAERSGVNIARISRLENDRANLRLPNFLDLLRILKISAGEALDPDLDEKSRFLQMARKLRGVIGTTEMEWLSDLERIEARLAIEGAHKEVEYHRSKLHPRETHADPPNGEIHPIKRGDPF
jgi:transcriptional regulator with XRE-family HTH domain